MAEILVLVDHVDGAVRKTTLELLTLARRAGEPAAVFLGSGFDAARDTLGEYGAAKVYVVEAPELEQYLVVPKAEALAQIAQSSGAGGVLLTSSPEGKEIAARLAVKLGSGVITDAVDVTADLTTTQSVFAGGYTVTAQVTKGTPVITVKPNAATPEAAPATPAEEKVAVAFSDAATKARIVERKPRAATGRPELTEASIVVSGGRGTGGDFAPVEALADALGAAVGASRAAVDSGWYPHAYQVGQTGKTVSPQLYLACGISGAIQHRAGMQTSKTIVVVNKDPEAPIFAMADFGVVGDLHAVLPQATAEIQKRKG
ncbi:electron transfer flavoprotein subunit alpha/FixB family protein [Jiangella rhizosphaerae]|uniref:Electron transfer flavoprotein subunit alpha/FixB family protein n=1 Tax=Jiangella rhizosphaerae TaxID=2293569 RepID=A0A418KUJ5_9ACTN|nr:electron transfer flavoprotein subunit alpha/FixB family protein [Jiangella rhizosphaerae]RIQ30885.1 electron transfer flavoprotein subunit alpha/FixB family protein [Jiangella rhizosphaerae]